VISSLTDDESFHNSQKALLDPQAMLLELKDKGMNKADIDAQKKEVEEEQRF